MDTKILSIDYELLVRACRTLDDVHIDIGSRASSASSTRDAAALGSSAYAAATANRALLGFIKCMACAGAPGAEDALEGM